MKAACRRSRSAHAVLALMFALAACGCGRERSSRPPDKGSPAGGPVQPARTGGEQAGKIAQEGGDRVAAHLQEVLAMWSRGDKDKATKEFLLINWQKRGEFSKESAFGLTEQEFIALPPNEQNKRSSELVELKGLCRSVLDAGRTAAAQGDREQAKRHILAVQQCGRLLARDAAMSAVVQSMGKALDHIASKELTELESAAPKKG
jgi:hypothetical protein